MMQVNVKSALYGMQEVLPHFSQRGSGQIVNVSSMLGRMPFATFRSAYCGAKHFLNALTAHVSGRAEGVVPRHRRFAGLSRRRPDRFRAERRPRRARFAATAWFAERRRGRGSDRRRHRGKNCGRLHESRVAGSRRRVLRHRSASIPHKRRGPPELALDLGIGGDSADRCVPSRCRSGCASSRSSGTSSGPSSRSAGASR